MGAVIWNQVNQSGRGLLVLTLSKKYGGLLLLDIRLIHRYWTPNRIMDFGICQSIYIMMPKKLSLKIK